MAQTDVASVELDETGRALLRVLVAQLPKVKPGEPRTYISYKDIHDELGLHLSGPTYGESLKTQGLNSLADWTQVTGKPGITGLIIDKTTMMPGSGYFKLFGRQPDDFPWWQSEIEKSKSFDWSASLLNESAGSDSVSGEDWEVDELHASVVAYLEMLRHDRNGTPFIKKKYYEDLAAKFGRTAKAFEYRMQNISYVLLLMGRDWLSGLRPAKNVGAKVAAQIEQLIAEVEGRQVTPVVAFEIAVREDVKKKQLPMPQGSRAPKAVTASVTQYQRDPSVKAWILKQAEGVCECCKRPAPFDGADGFPYLEVHHVRQLADKGSDTTANAVAVCPNCHRELHYGEGAKELVAQFYQTLKRLKRE